MWRYSLVSLVSIMWCGCLLAQSVVFSAAPSANRIGIKDQVQVQYTIQNAQNIRTIEPGNFPDFNVLGGPYQSSSSSTQINGNQVIQSHSETITYVLQPKRQGVLSVQPAIARDAAGHAYQSNPFTIEVVPGSVAGQQRRQPNRGAMGDDDDPFAAIRRMQQMQNQAMQQRGQPQQQQPQQQEPEVKQADIDKDLFIRVSVDKSKVHVGEQITTSYKLYSRIPMQIGISALPSLNGFWTQDFDIPRQAKPTEEILDGKKYQVFLLKKSALFPQQSGTLELDAAEAQGVARIVQQVKQRMSDMFNGTLMMSDPVFNNQVFSRMAYRDVKVHLKSTPFKIEVTPLPEKNKPVDYGGAVGDFKIAGKIDKKEMTTDDVATVTLTISGSGNLKLIEAPKLNLPNGLSTYDPQILDTITGRSTTISGDKIITYAITPHTIGDYDIPSVPFTFFNPHTGSYVTLQTTPLKLYVKPGKHYNNTPVGNNVALTDIHNINTRPLDKLNYNRKPIMFTGTYWSMYAFPLFAFIGLLVYKRREEELSKDTVLLRKRRANKIAFQRLATAKKLLLQNSMKPFYEEISKAIWLYLSDKLNIPLSSLSRETATDAMNARNIPAELQEKIGHIMSECEVSLYATAVSQQMNHIYQEAIHVISDLEDNFKS